MSSKTKSKSGAKFLLPGSVGSAILWFVRKSASGGYLDGEVRLTDCSRTITWSLDEKSDLTKLDAAISELTKARNALAKMLEVK